MNTRKITDGTVTFKDDQATKEALFDYVLNWFLEQEVFDGECIMQSDAPQLEAPILLSEIAEEIFQFNPTWDE